MFVLTVILLSILIVFIFAWAITMSVLYSSSNKKNKKNDDHTYNQKIEQPQSRTHLEMVFFPLEGLHIPIPTSHSKLMTTMASREPKLRTLMFDILQDVPEMCTSNKSCIIDAGAYIGDNAIPWSVLGHNILAIDPSPENCNLITSIGQDRITVIEAGLGNKRESLHFKGDITHLRFDQHEEEKQQITQNSEKLEIYPLDQILPTGTSVKLLHLDVEGFELFALQGAVQMITRDWPMLLLETHISMEKSKIMTIFNMVEAWEYTVFVVKECCGADATCRNIVCVKRDNIALCEYIRDFSTDIVQEMSHHQFCSEAIHVY